LPKYYIGETSVIDQPDHCVVIDARDKTIQNRPMFDPELVAYFWRNLEKRGPDECWLWRGGTTAKERGIVIWKGKMLSPSRISWEVNKNDPPGRLFVLHKCDVGLCCNPGHLFLGTHNTNMEDMANKARACCGPDHPNAKLTEAAVKEIAYSFPEERRKLAAKYGVSVSMIDKARKCETYCYVRVSSYVPPAPELEAAASESP
jgi:hypothetical protein